MRQSTSSTNYTTTSSPTTSASPTMPPKSGKPSGKTAQRSAIEDVVAREYTIHLHKRVRSV